MRTWFFYWYWYELVCLGLMTYVILYLIKWYLLNGEDEFVLISRYLRKRWFGDQD